MALYLIAFNDEWVPDLTVEELRERGRSGRAVIEEMTAAGAFVFSDRELGTHASPGRQCGDGS